MSIQTEKIDIRKLNAAELIAAFEEVGEKKYRANQVIEWLWKKGAKSFDEMTNLSLDLRNWLDNNFIINKIRTETVQRSEDGTIKVRFQLHDGHFIESVLIPVARDERFTVCVSSQVGCSLTCSFCATGKMKRIRNLDPGEIVDQFVFINEECEKTYGRGLSNVVYMGMGEPLLAYKNVLQSIDWLTWNKGINLSPRRITVSTAGIAKMIKKLADDEVRFNLALSLHAANDAKRDEIMPINEQNNLETLMESLEYFCANTKNKVSYEYIALENFNDTVQDAKDLIKLCRRFPVKVNVIEYNPVEGVDFNRTSDDKMKLFTQTLLAAGVRVTIRKSRGKDIDAACGQLANKN